MDQQDTAFLAGLAAELVRIDSRSRVSNLALAERLAAELGGFEVEALEYADEAGVAKRVLVAHRGGPGGLALSGHMDTVPETGWTEDPFSGRIDAAGVLHGLGSADMKGPIAACVAAARGLPAALPITLLLTTDEETTKQGAREILARSMLARRAAPRGIVVAEPTRLVPLRGHRASITFIAEAEGIQAHSSTGQGRNANWALIPFLAEMRALFERVRDDPALRDPAYDPPFGDFNLVIDNHGAAVNVTVPRATARIKFRYSARIDPAPIADAVRAAAARAGVALRELREGKPPELPEDHPLIRAAAAVSGIAPRTAAFGTDASELSALAPCVVLGPGDIGVAHRPGESVPLAELARGAAMFARLAEAVAAG
ncbi:MAG: M20/M25/M40 family metallo-hydrolase [Rhodospirillales bacterium]|nr:M20/M25/M40 family metallo-hydrolase [Rhodospirillales bacterium]